MAMPTDQTLPILDYKPFEDIMQESEFAARKDTKQVAVKIPEDCLEVESRRIAECCWEHGLQNFAQGRRPVSQHHDCSTANLDRGNKVCGGKRPLLSAQPVFLLYGAEEEDQPQ